MSDGERIMRHSTRPGRPGEDERAFEDHLIAIPQDQRVGSALTRGQHGEQGT